MKFNRKPDLDISGFQIWVHGRQFPESEDYWDGNWLNVTIHCITGNSDIWDSGPIINLSGLRKLAEDLQQLADSQANSIFFEAIEPNLNIEFGMTTNQDIKMKVSLTPNPLQESHAFMFEFNVDNLRTYIQDIRNILKAYPLKG